MPPLKHVHQYVRVKGSKEQFKCAYPRCSHVWSKKYIRDNVSICNRCLEEFVLDSYALERSKPMCKKCRTRKRDVNNTNPMLFGPEPKDLINALFTEDVEE